MLRFQHYLYYQSPVHTGDKVLFDMVDCVALAPYTLVTKSKGRWTFQRQKLPTFDKIDPVLHVQIWRPKHGRQVE